MLALYGVNVLIFAFGLNVQMSIIRLQGGRGILLYALFSGFGWSYGKCVQVFAHVGPGPLCHAYFVKVFVEFRFS